ncbi:phosphoglycerate dehydrogenase [bacterium]|nr:phosphoglycerate dehydrogenase [bacterium]
MFKVLVTAHLHPIALEMMKREGLQLEVKPLLPKEEILKVISEFHGIVTRSDTAVDQEILDAGSSLKVVGRAAIGIDNIDVDHATKKGVLVVHVPADNVVSAAEHTFALLLGAVRNVTTAGLRLQEKIWNRKEFDGLELRDKTLGIVGLGKVGSNVANIASGFGMNLIAYDPYISREKFEKFSAKKANSLKELLNCADMVTIHTPKTRETMGMFDYLSLKEMKPGSVLVNCARGGIVDEESLLRVLDEGHLLRAGIDVFEEEPCVGNPLHFHPHCICTPHLGASTVEAQSRVGKTIAVQMAKALKNGVVDYPVNMPLVEGELFAVSRGFCSLAEKMGRLARQLITFQPSLMRMSVCGKDMGDQFDILKAAYFKGYFEDTTEERVNYVNSVKIAENHGLKFEAIKDPLHETYSTLLKIEVYGDGPPVSLSGTLFAQRSKIVEINGYPMDIVPEGTMLLIRNEDRPGVIGFVGGVLGKNGVNIARWELGRKELGGEALGLLKLDERIPSTALKELEDYEGITEVKELDFSLHS